MDELARALLNALLQALPNLIEAATNALAQLSVDRGQAIWNQIATSVQGGDINFLTRTPPGLSYNLGSVMELYRQIEPGMLGAVTLSVTCAGLAVVGREYFGWSWEPGEWATRVFLGVLLSLSLPRVYSFTIDWFNTICDAISAAPLPAAPTTSGVDLLELAVLMVVWIVLGLRLIIRMGYRLVYLGVLLVVGPIAMMAWVIPGGYPYFVMWRTAYIGMLVGQVLVVLCLRLAAGMVSPLGTSWASIAVSAAVLMLAHDLVTVIAPVRGGGVFGMVRQSATVVRRAWALT